MQSVAQAWLVLELTNSPFRLGLVGTLQFAPMLVLSFFAGALADRLPKRRLVMVSQSVLFAQALLLAGLVQCGCVQSWHVAVLALLYGVANTVDMPTRQAFIVEMVGRDDLMNAIALNSAMFNAARIVGPALAGFAIAHWGTPVAFFVNALSFLPVLVILAVIRNMRTPDNASYNATFSYPRGGAIEYVKALASEVRPGCIALEEALVGVDLSRRVARTRRRDKST